MPAGEDFACSHNLGGTLNIRRTSPLKASHLAGYTGALCQRLPTVQRTHFIGAWPCNQHMDPAAR